jgi:hypothetical protein
MKITRGNWNEEVIGPIRLIQFHDWYSAEYQKWKDAKGGNARGADCWLKVAQSQKERWQNTPPEQLAQHMERMRNARKPGFGKRSHATRRERLLAVLP